MLHDLQWFLYCPNVLVFLRWISLFVIIKQTVVLLLSSNIALWLSYYHVWPIVHIPVQSVRPSCHKQAKDLQSESSLQVNLVCIKFAIDLWACSMHGTIFTCVSGPRPFELHTHKRSCEPKCRTQITPNTCIITNWHRQHKQQNQQQQNALQYNVTSNTYALTYT